MSSTEAAAANRDLETLKATYDRLRHERDRLRNARGFFARGLGPAPASAGIATGIVAAVGEGQNLGFLLAAVSVLVIMVALSTWYGSKPAYRHLYAKQIQCLRTRIGAETQPEGQCDGSTEPPEDSLSAENWYWEMIRLERDIYGRRIHDENRPLPPWAPVENLQDGADLERTGTVVVQGLWLVVIGFLLTAAVA